MPRRATTPAPPWTVTARKLAAGGWSADAIAAKLAQQPWQVRRAIARAHDGPGQPRLTDEEWVARALERRAAKR